MRALCLPSSFRATLSAMRTSTPRRLESVSSSKKSRRASQVSDHHGSGYLPRHHDALQRMSTASSSNVSAGFVRTVWYRDHRSRAGRVRRSNPEYREILILRIKTCPVSGWVSTERGNRHRILFVLLCRGHEAGLHYTETRPAGCG